MVRVYAEGDAGLDASTAVMIAFFGIWVPTLEPRDTASTALGFLALVDGIQYVVFNLWARSVGDAWEKGTSGFLVIGLLVPARISLLAEALGIRPARAHEMLAEVGRETGAGVA